ncbi:uncharacterized protein LACBIDRAFT_332223 [Laccaria bicolor S238N-H82]|uniref:Predicted protein n=1 Tax=Laccaria bicolor (strain S238N-H82 / ATCC MYA-4686) TaxID=486041 RepID=B0DS06_LACBS|nr:uncharacterized protein LACBIDRAFT_332223 [Laccaria bicolor S238N-H82]EDR02702.1 predicted protein [Laccaria bicolor S238N-H82]|eukprot:XP_001886746.1 predicted protein [Laccaria bicolor S238N-H82]
MPRIRGLGWLDQLDTYPSEKVELKFEQRLLIGQSMSRVDLLEKDYKHFNATDLETTQKHLAIGMVFVRDPVVDGIVRIADAVFWLRFAKCVEKRTSEVFPMRNWRGQNFGPKNCNIWGEKQVETGQKLSKVGTCAGLWLEATQKGQRIYQKGISLHFESLV